MSSSGLFPPPKRDRRSRINKLKLILNDNQTDSPEKIVAKFCLNEGISLRTVREYLKFLKLTGEISDDISI